MSHGMKALADFSRPVHHGSAAPSSFSVQYDRCALEHSAACSSAMNCLYEGSARYSATRPFLFNRPYVAYSSVAKLSRLQPSHSAWFKHIPNTNWSPGITCTVARHSETVVSSPMDCSLCIH